MLISCITEDLVMNLLELGRQVFTKEFAKENFIVDWLSNDIRVLITK